MAEKPTTEQVKEERPDIEEYVIKNDSNLSLSDYIDKALAQVKRDLRNLKTIKWSMVYDEEAGDYFKNTDGEAINKDLLHDVIILLSVAYVFENYSVAATEDDSWGIMHQRYMNRYNKAFEEMKIDVDWDESGAITECEENQNMQRFMRR